MKFRIEGQDVTLDTAKEVQNLLKASGIQESIKNILAGKVDGVVLVPDEEVAPVTPPVDEVVAEQPAVEPATEPTDDFMAPESDAEVARRKQAEQDEADVGANVPADAEVEYPEIGAIKDEKAFKKFVKKLSDAQVFDWCELEGATWKRCKDQPPIDRMRAVMAIKAKHFPHTAPKSSGKSKSKYADYTTEQLVQLALDNDVTIRDDKGDERILRMYAIMALREAGIIA